MAKRRTKRTVKKPSGDHTSNTSNCTNVQEATMKPYGSSHVKIFGQVDVNLENTVHLLQTNGVKVTVRDEEPVRRTIPISLGSGKENDPNKAIYIDKGKRERFRGLISQKELCALTPPIEGVVRDVPKGSQISSKRSKITSKHGSLSINPLTPAPLDVLHANVTSAASTATPDRFGISKRLNIHSLVIPRNLGIELLPLQLNKHAIKTNLPWLEQRHLDPVSACSVPVSSTSAALNFVGNLHSCSTSFSSVPQTSTSLSSECVEESDISRRTLAQRARRESVGPSNTSFMEHGLGETKTSTFTFSMSTASTSPQVERALMDGHGDTKRRKIMCDVEPPYISSMSIATWNGCGEDRVQIRSSLAPSATSQIDVPFLEGESDVAEVSVHTNIVHGMPQLQLASTCSSVMPSSSGGQDNQAVVTIEAEPTNLPLCSTSFSSMPYTSTTLSMECGSKTNLSRHTLAQRLRREREREKGLIRPRTKFHGLALTPRAIRKASFEENAHGDLRASTSTSFMPSASTTHRVDRTLDVDQHLPTRRNILCGAESSFSPSSFIALRIQDELPVPQIHTLSQSAPSCNTSHHVCSSSMANSSILHSNEGTVTTTQLLDSELSRLQRLSTCSLSIPSTSVVQTHMYI